MAPISCLAVLTTLIALSTSIHATTNATASSVLLPHQDDVTLVSPEVVASFKPYTWYAATTDCKLSDIVTWTCGEICDANPTFKPIATGGDGIVTQFVGYDPTLKEVIVSHQGTDPSKIIPIITDVWVFLDPLDPILFPGVDSSILVHAGFAGTHGRSAPGVLTAVEKTLSLYQTKTVTIVGHSLSAAIALLDAVYLPLHLPADVTVRYVGYASPRVGNQGFADYVDAQGLSVTRITNKQDAVRVLPTREFFEYHHTRSDIHIQDDGVWVSCPSQDNPSDQCNTGAVTLSNSNRPQHLGPSDGVYMGSCKPSSELVDAMLDEAQTPLI